MMSEPHIMAIQPAGDRPDADGGVLMRQFIGRNYRFCITDIARAEQDLAAEIRRVNGVERAWGDGGGGP